jgi:hypothetical protein
MRKPRAVNELIQVGQALVSPDVLRELFACDLARCKGACCVEGDIGAPLEPQELAVLETIQAEIRPFLRREGLEAIEEQGEWVRDETGGFSTPLVKGRECAYVSFAADGTALCGIEQAYFAGATAFRKPISCHLYPIRVRSYRGTDRLYYDRWDICSPACARGKQAGVKVYQFLKEALIRAYGEEFYAELEALDQHLGQQGESSL